MKYIDLSYEISKNMPVYPGDLKVSLTEEKNYLEDKYTSFILNTGLHTGTHIDCPMHLTESKRFISEYPIENFIGKGVIIDTRGETEIVFKEKYRKLFQEKEMLIIYTGFEEKYGTDEYYSNHPVVSDSFAQEIVNSNIKMIGFDMPSPDKYPFNVHKTMLGNNVFILENLCNLNKLLEINEFNIIAMPLKIKAEASLVRAIAIIS